MKTDKTYKIAFAGLPIGKHGFEYKVDKKFFEQYEYSLVQNGAVDVKLIFDKQETMFILDFDILGTIEIPCDRCLASMPLAIALQERQVVKILEEEFESDGDVIIIRRGESEFDVGPLIYEHLNLQVPIITDCNAKQVYCDKEMLQRLKQLNHAERDIEKPIDPRWERLKGLTNN